MFIVKVSLTGETLWETHRQPENGSSSTFQPIRDLPLPLREST